ncbi:MAG: hypothetical protein E7448_08780 [Ruminococcaceae bacterium]|nr:hypothetical protein [Oscillospiraceae bacterium]
MSTALGFSASIVISAGLLRYAVAYCFIVAPTPDVRLDWWAEIFNSFFNAIRTFKMGEEYEKNMLELASAVGLLLPAEHWALEPLRNVLVAYASLLNLLGPIVGGAMIIEALAGVFPRFKLAWSYLQIRRTKYFFSELNDASVALAKSIRITKKKEHPVLIFANAHANKKTKEHELLLEAKQYGAICLGDDLLHIAKPGFGQREYYLMDENEFSNLQTLTELTDEHHIKALKDACVYLFVQSEAYVQIEMQIKDRLENDRYQKLLKGGNPPTIIPVNGYRNLVQNLLMDVPLYEPLVHKADPTKLQVTILGNGAIGTEAFLSIYWFGQMMISRDETMQPCDLTVNVVSMDSEETFWSKIDYINPEIKATVQVLSDTTANGAGDLLCYNSKGEKNKPYCSVRYVQADVQIGNLWSREKEEELLDSDYIIVALGADANNIAVAERLCRVVGKKHFEAVAAKGDYQKTVIAYAVYDTGLAKTLNEHKRHQLCGRGVTDVYMHPFGSLEQVYSCDNVHMSKSSLLAEETGNTYFKTQHQEEHIEDNEKRSRDGQNSNYNYWASLARASHMKYKVFSLGWIRESVFDYTSDSLKVSVNKRGQYERLPEEHKGKYREIPADVYHRERIQQVCKTYKQIAISNGTPRTSEQKTLKNELEQKKHCLAWLEHRRWNAFTRVMGYRYTDAETILTVKNSQKDMQLKLHACLVEARCPECGPDDRFLVGEFKENGKVNTDTAFQQYPGAQLDALDQVSYARREHDSKKTSADYKAYDYYRYEFDDYLSAEELAEWIHTEPETILRNCRKGKYKGAVYFENGLQWHIPVESAQEQIEKSHHKLNPKDAAEKEWIDRCKAGLCPAGRELFDQWYVPKEKLQTGKEPVGKA